MEPIPNTFAAYRFTDFEVHSALAAITPVMEAILQTRLSQLATEKVELQIDPAMPASFIQSEAFLTGGYQEIKALLEQIREARQTSYEQLLAARREQP